MSLRLRTAAACIREEGGRAAASAARQGAAISPPPTTLYCTQFRNTFLARRPTELSEPGPYVGELKAQSSSIQGEIFFHFFSSRHSPHP